MKFKKDIKTINESLFTESQLKQVLTAQQSAWETQFNNSIKLGQKRDVNLWDEFKNEFDNKEWKG